MSVSICPFSVIVPISDINISEMSVDDAECICDYVYNILNSPVLARDLIKGHPRPSGNNKYFPQAEK